MVAVGGGGMSAGDKLGEIIEPSGEQDEKHRAGNGPLESSPAASPCGFLNLRYIFFSEKSHVNAHLPISPSLGHPCPDSPHPENIQAGVIMDKPA